MALKQPPYRRQDLSDPYLRGSFSYRGKGMCDVCHNAAFGILIHDVELPMQIGVEHTILKGYAPVHRKGHVFFVGVNCGCYGKFHRQIAHIITNMNIRHRNEPTWTPIPTP